ncbi:hypothetical protein MJ004_12975 [Acinetobacter junii]|uniref:hypothetical protein n=1 Tax=Acinetobacter junii TaxID=40215 RepID=UPI0022EA729E|nr:hypothetical protein [Acinetobacter junii]MDA3509304.1 hypothetical protein [Acinetobacter junii]MDA3533603.1 hypothetical protein [Acinetobacter junii]
MSKLPQNPYELENHLKENIGFLEASASLFDKGKLSEAKRLAVTCRVLLHDTNNSNSISNQLGIKKLLRFIDSSTPYEKKCFNSYLGLLVYRLFVNLNNDKNLPKRNPELSPTLRRVYPHPIQNEVRYKSFEEWWSQIVIEDVYGATFSRRQIVLALSNKDGGAHVDPLLDQDYINLTRHNSHGFNYCDESGESISIADAALNTMRQIAYEVIETFKDAGYECID